MFSQGYQTLGIIRRKHIVLHMSPQNADFRCTPLFRWVSWYHCVGNNMAFQFLPVATSPRTNGMLWQRSKVKVAQKMDYSKI